MARNAYLIHWDADDAEAYATDLRAAGWHVDVESEDGARAYERISADVPDVVLIFLTHAPSHGRETGHALRSTGSTRNIPLIFVEGSEEAVAQTKSAVPDALFLARPSVQGVLRAFASTSGGAEVTLSYKVTLEDYNPDWPSSFEAERDRLVAVPAIADFVRDVQHVGSTAVPGLAAKAIIDLLLAVERIADGEALVAPLEALAYVYRHDLASLMPDRFFFERGVDGGLRYHVLVTEFHGPHWDRYVLFRDYLRVHPGEADRYSELKKQLAAEHGDQRHFYSEAKAEYVSTVLEKARAEFGGG